MVGLGAVIHDILPMVAKVAPNLASVLGGPLAGVAVSLLAKSFGVAPDAIAGLSGVIAGDPDANIKIQALEIEHGQIMADMANARAAGVARKDSVPAILAFAILILYTIVQITAIYIPGSQDDVISARVQDILLFVMAYYFGSSNMPPGAKPPGA